MSIGSSQRKLRRGALASAVWTIIGIAVALIVASLVYAYATHGAAGVVQLTVRGVQVSSSQIIVEIRNTGIGNVKVNQVVALNDKGSEIKCTVSTVKRNGNTVSLPVMLRSGDTLTVYLTGSQCQDAVTVLVETDAGVFKGIVSS